MQHYEESSACYTLLKSTHTVDILAKILQAQHNDEGTQALLLKLERGELADTDYHIRDGLLFYRQRILVPDHADLRRALLQEFHSTPTGGHGGVKRTMARLAPQFFWAKMRKDIEHFVATCSVCQLSKSETKRVAGLLQPLPIPEAIWSDISMDFIVGLPKSKGKSVVLVVVDRLTKYAHFIAMAKGFTAVTVANAFVADICRLHGIPRSIVSDRDPIFVSNFWEEIFRLSGTTLKRSSAYHPESDGQTEITNKGLEQYLRSFCMDHISTWVSYLPWAEFSYNSATHSATRMSPFQAVYERLPPPIVAYEEEKTTNAAAHDFLARRAALLKILRIHLAEAQNRMKQMADRSRPDVHFAVGEKVLVRLQPCRQMSLAEHTFSKLRRRFYGPFPVVKKIGNVAYKLALPDLEMHPVPLPQDTPEGKIIIQPAAVVRQRCIVGRTADRIQGLIRWEGLPEEEDTWMDMDKFKLAFPGFDLGDKVRVEGESNVMPQETLHYRRAKGRSSDHRNYEEMSNIELSQVDTHQAKVAEEDKGLNLISSQAAIEDGPSKWCIKEVMGLSRGPSGTVGPSMSK